MFAGVIKKSNEKVRKDILEDNRKAAIFWATIQLIFWSFSLFMSRIDSEYIDCLPVYIIVLVICGIALYLALYICPKHLNLVPGVAMALNMALNAAKKSGKTVVIFQLEMSNEQITTRLLSSEALIDSKKLRMGNLNDDDWRRMAGATTVLQNAPILIDDNSGITVAEMKAKCRRLGSDLGLIVIDYLQLMHAPKHTDNRVQEVAEISRSLKIMAKDLNVPVLCCCQLSRGPEGRQDKRPMLSDLRESGSIEQDADIVLFIYRDDYYNSEGENHNAAELIVAKNRHGETGKIDLQWMGQFTAFTSQEKRHG